MSENAYDHAVNDPLVGVLRDAWHLYRPNAARMLLLAAALYAPAVVVTTLITVNRASTTWCYVADGLATFLLITVVAARPPPPREGTRPMRVRLTTAVVRAAPAAVILAATCLAMIRSESFMGHFEFVVAIPAIYLMFIWALTVPVVVIEDLSALPGLRRSWHLLRGHGSAVVDTVAKAYGVWILVMVVPILLISIPGEPVVLHWVIPTIAVDLCYGPFLAIVLTLVYYRLAGARSAAERDAHQGLDAGPEPAPAA